MKINFKQFRKWIRALDSGEFKQTKKVLQDEFGYCCLGVGCEVLVEEKKLNKSSRGLIIGTQPNEQRAAPKWLKKINDDFSNKTTEPLVWVNDSMDFTFPEIATMLELVYIHKALK